MTVTTTVHVQQFEALQILESAYHNGHITAVYQALDHLDAEIDRLDDNDKV